GGSRRTRAPGAACARASCRPAARPPRRRSRGSACPRYGNRRLRSGRWRSSIYEILRSQNARPASGPQRGGRVRIQRPGAAMRFPGIIPAVTTPFTENDTIDFEGIRANVDALLRGGVHGLVATGTMGESASLDLDERKQVTAAICEAAGGRVPVLAGIAAPTARVATRYALAAREAGATALMMLPPLNYNGDFREIAGYFAAVGDLTGMEIMAYNNPGASGVELSVEMIARLGNEVDAVVAIKECSGETRNIAAIIGATSDDFEVVVGGDDFALEGFCAGATGWVSGVANVIPADCVKLYDACREGDL